MNNDTWIYYNGELYHAGVKGMQWGKHLPGTTWWKDFPGRQRISKAGDQLNNKLRNSPVIPKNQRNFRGGIKGTNVGPEYEQELEFNSQENVYPGSKPKSKSSRFRPQSKVDKIDKKLENYQPLNKEFDEFNNPVSYRKVNDERPFRIRGPYWRDVSEKNNKDPIFQIKKYATRTYRKLRDKAFAFLKKSIDTYIDKSFSKYLEYYSPPKGSDKINHLRPYIEKESDEALTTYITAVSTGDIGDYINSFIQSSQMNIVNGCSRFLDSVGLDDEVYSFLKKLGIKDK